ncbi:MAG: deoxyguanosinetriphosphate triphosphohydrolase [Thermovirgaceae bacterium]
MNTACPRKEWETFESTFLSPEAAKSSETRGRRNEERPCPLRTCYQRDRDRIIHSKAFRRLKHKTQVLLLPEGDHYRTRLTHTLEVSQIARVISRALKLNEDLTEAIALGHDLGHTPFGHMGERILDDLVNSRGRSGFHHAAQSLRVVDVLEKEGQGLNLTEEVRDGILHHSKGQVDVRDGFSRDLPMTMEGWVVRVSDSIAYLNHDLDDALRAGIVDEEALPPAVARRLGSRHSLRIGAIVQDVTEHSRGGLIVMSDGILEAVETLRAFLFENVYAAGRAGREEPRVRHVLGTLFSFFEERPEALPERHGPDSVQHLVDFVSGMTDSYAMVLFERIAMPSPWPHDPLKDCFPTSESSC